MKRRRFLQAGAASASALACPPFLALALADACTGDERIEALFDAYRAARRAEKPLLVLVIPSGDEAKGRRGTLLGQALVHADDETLALLARTVLVAATLEELDTLVELPDDASDTATFVVGVDTARRPATVQPHRAPPLPRPVGSMREFDSWEDFRAAETAQVDAEIDRIGALYRQAVRALLALQPPPAHDAAAERTARAIEQGGAVDNRRVLQSAHHLQGLAEATGSAPLRRALADAMRAEIGKPITGSFWASSYGCGVTIEQPEPVGPRYACGMGHVPAKSKRFLHFFTR